MKYTIVIKSMLFVVVSAACWFVWQPHNGQLILVALNVGQGDATYIRTEQGNDILVDGGPNRSVLAELGSVMPPFDHQLEYVVATHPDSDHIAGLMEVTDRYSIQNLITNGHGKDTHVFQQFATWMNAQRLTPVIVRRGDRINIDSDVWLEVIGPTDQEHDDTNEDSIVIILHDHAVRIMLTGDAPSTEEDDILSAYSPEVLDVDVLKVGHHGSHFSTSNTWLATLTPQIALISAGLQNRYHHPHPSVLYRLKKARAEIYRTDMQGRITCHSDGSTVTCAPQRK